MCGSCIRKYYVMILQLLITRRVPRDQYAITYFSWGLVYNYISLFLKLVDFVLHLFKIYMPVLITRFLKDAHLYEIVLYLDAWSDISELLQT